MSPMHRPVLFARLLGCALGSGGLVRFRAAHRSPAPAGRSRPVTTSGRRCTCAASTTAGQWNVIRSKAPRVLAGDDRGDDGRSADRPPQGDTAERSGTSARSLEHKVPAGALLRRRAHSEQPAAAQLQSAHFRRFTGTLVRAPFPLLIYAWPQRVAEQHCERLRGLVSIMPLDHPAPGRRWRTRHLPLLLPGHAIPLARHRSAAR